MGNDQLETPLIFSGTVEQYDDGNICLTVTREDGTEKIWHFPATKVKLFRSLGGQLGIALAFMLGEDI